MASDVPLPGRLLEGSQQPDVAIRWGTVPATIEDVIGEGLIFQASARELLLDVEGTARFLISDGRRVVVEGSPGVPDSRIRLFLLGSVFGAILHQRGLLPLHGSAVEVGDRCMIFVGVAGSGKSTVAAALAKR
ncbi:MAG: hypothetical protein KJO17_06695, partial [Acidimicrobiia bacterium]|nr:hypothetical protein [Acidimicrobiia bacterium]